MKKNLTIIFISILFLTFISCEGSYKYPNNKSLSEKNGATIDSIPANYITDTILFDGKLYIHNWDQTTKEQLNEVLSETSSPVLFNYYLDRENIRLVIMDSTSSMIIDVNNMNDEKYWLSSKKINHITNDSLSFQDIQTRTQNISKDQWLQIDTLLNNTLFIDMENTNLNNVSNEYPYYFIEFHGNKKYFYLLTNTKNNKALQLVEYLSKLNKLKLYNAL